MRYDIRITKFFRQGTTILFRFEFDATVGGEPLITMRDGCAGFFTAEELAAGKGIAPAKLESRMRPGDRPEDREPDLIPTSPTQLDEAAVEALRRGDLAAAFGAPFDGLPLADAVALPGGRMAMIRRVTTLDPTGGPAGLGFIRAEADIRPGDWYMVCHFVDDRVMPGTLMYECCLHALRILLMRLGWVGRRGRGRVRAGAGRRQPAQVPRADHRGDPARRLRDHDQGAGLSPRALRDRRRPDLRRRQADRLGHRPGPPVVGDGARCARTALARMYRARTTIRPV